MLLCLSCLQEGLTKIESRKCLPLMYQLAARLGTKAHDNPLFQGTLNEVSRPQSFLPNVGEERLRDEPKERLRRRLLFRAFSN